MKIPTTKKISLPATTGVYTSIYLYKIKYHFNKKFRVYTGTQVLSASLLNDIFGLKKWNGIIGVEYYIAENLFFETRFRHGFENQEPNSNFRDNRISLGIGYKF